MRCPSCFVPLDPDRFTWLLTSGDLDVDEQASRLAGAEVSNRGTVTVRRPMQAPKTWRPDPRMALPALQGPAYPACPNCHYRLPDDARTSTIVCIAMSGARTTGKSLYVAVMVKQLRYLAQALGTVLEAADPRTQQVYESVYERPLYVERGLMEATAEAASERAYQREPLVWSLGRINGRRHYLAVRDVAGEDMERSMQDAPQFQFLRWAQAVFFMFDPLAVASVRAKLAGLIPDQQVSGVRPQDVLSNLMRLLGDRAPRIAVVLSKFDALQALADVDDAVWRAIMSNAGAAFMRDEPQLSRSYDRADGELLSAEVASLLDELDTPDIALALANPHSGRPFQHRFFAVSVLGAPPEGRELNQRGISPFRCLDPLKWTLAEEGVIPTR